MERLQQIENAFPKIVHILANQKCSSGTIYLLVVDYTVVDLIPQLPATHERLQLFVLFADEEGNWNVLVEGFH